MTASEASDTPKIVHDDLRVLRDPDRGRYELWQGDQYIGFLGYTVDETTGPNGERESVVRLQHLSLIHISEPTRRTPVS